MRTDTTTIKGKRTTNYLQNIIHNITYIQATHIKERDCFGYPLIIKSLCDLNKIMFQVLFYYQGVCHSPNQSDTVALD